jgi:hypothetical protein
MPKRGDLMAPKLRSLFLAFLVVGVAAGFLKSAGKMPAQEPAAQEAIACRVLESKRAATMGVEVAVFHPADAASRERLGSFLESHDGASVEFEIAGGDWQPATVFRLKSCFGRGLLVFPAARIPVARGRGFLIRASARSQSAP